MTKRHSTYIIVGAGLAGLTIGYQMLKAGEDDFIILEGRDRVGGRVMIYDGIDMGATWLQHYHTHLLQLLDELNLRRFDQYSKGKGIFVYNTQAPPQYFENNPNEPSASRIAGGSIALINALAKSLRDKIRLNTIVSGVSDERNQVVIHTDNGDFSSEKIVLTLPPRIAAGIAFDPALPKNLVNAMIKTHTWMSNSAKVGLTYPTPFWRGKNLSGTVVGQVGAVIELYDHSDQSGTTFSLMGFIHEGLRNASPKDRKEQILAYLEKYLGSEARKFLDYHEKDWSTDPFTTSKELQSLPASPHYGNPLFQHSYMNGKLLFSGTETSPVYGGYLEGAVFSGLSAAKALLENE